jgi:3-oxoacyl-[acyl-carrier-protein] synthase III
MTKIAKIIGIGSYLPERILSNCDLEKMVETSNEWIVTRTGIKERRIARADEYTSSMGIMAANRALNDAKISGSDVDFILVATFTPDYIFPSTACLIQQAIGAKNAAALDIQAACSGFLYALQLAKSLVENGQCKNILIVAAEKISSIIDYKDRSTCVLFGDGAAACVVGKEGKGLAIRGVSLGADGEHAELLLLPGGGCRLPASKESVEEGKHFLKMAGSEVFKHAVRRMENACRTCLDSLKMSEKEIDWLIPHQANERIIEAMAKRFLHLPQERIFKDVVHKCGNTSASSVVIALDELKREEKLQKGDNILLTAFGAGFTWGAAVLKND